MRLYDLMAAIHAAEAFTEKARKLAETTDWGEHNIMVGGTRLSGEVRRRSLDLTRSLADMRSSGRWKP